MDINIRKRIVYFSQIYMFAVYVGLAVRSLLLGRNDRMGLFYILPLLMGAVIIFSIIKGSMEFIDICMFAALFSGCCYTAIKCSDNSLYMVLLAVTMILLFAFLSYKEKRTAYIGPPAELFRIMMFILNILHFVFIFSVLFIGMESVTIFSIVQSILTIIFINILRYFIYQDMKSIVFMGIILELAVIMCMIIIMPWYPLGNIVEIQVEKNMNGYIHGFLCTLVLSLLEIPFNPVWSFEKSLKG